jgi:UPF0716 protein FxsA
MFKLFLLFTLIPVIEIYLLIQVGSLIGPLPTVVLLLGISAAGAWLVRSQGFLILRRVQEELAAGRLPATELMDGALVLVGGVLLVTPGFFTDALGLVFLLPMTRSLLKQVVRRWLEGRLSRGGVIVVRDFSRH